MGDWAYAFKQNWEHLRYGPPYHFNAGDIVAKMEGRPLFLVAEVIPPEYFHAQAVDMMAKWWLESAKEGQVAPDFYDIGERMRQRYSSGQLFCIQPIAGYYPLSGNKPIPLQEEGHFLNRGWRKVDPFDLLADLRKMKGKMAANAQRVIKDLEDFVYPV